MPVFQLQERHNEYLSPSAKSAISRAKTHWLKNTEVVDLLVNHERYRLPVSSDPPNKPAGRHSLLRAKTALSTDVPDCALPVAKSRHTAAFSSFTKLFHVSGKALRSSLGLKTPKRQA